MKKHLLLKITFSIIISLPLILILLNKTGTNNINYEKRVIKDMPIFNFDNISTYGKEYEEYFNDHFPYRNDIILLNRELKYKLFDEVEGDVLVGKDGWLFYNPKDETENIINDYIGKNLFSSKELDEITKKFININNLFKKKNIDFCILVAPNKNRIYSEYFPQSYGKLNENYRIKQITDYFATSSDIRAYDLTNVLLEKKYKLSELLYHKYDSHWNSLSGYISSQFLLKVFGTDIPNVLDDKLTIKKIKGASVDLAFLAGLYNLVDDDVDYSISFDANIKEENVSSINYMEVFNSLKLIEETHKDYFNSAHISIYKNISPIDNRKILIIGDSFADAMLHQLKFLFSETAFVSHLLFIPTMVNEFKPDIVIFESVERALRYRLNGFNILSLD